MRIDHIMARSSTGNRRLSRRAYAALTFLAAPLIAAQMGCSRQSSPSPLADEGQPIYASTAGVVRTVKYATDRLSGVAIVQVDNGGGIVSNYDVRAGTTLEPGQRIAAGALVSPVGKSEDMWIPVAAFRSGRINVAADTMHSFADSKQVVAVGNVVAELSRGRLKADALFSDPTATYVIASGHLSLMNT